MLCDELSQEAIN